MKVELASIAVLLAIATAAVAEPVANGDAVQSVAVQAPSAPPIKLQGGADSIDALLDRFLAAIAKGDVDELRRLRVTEDEYRRVIVPGRVPKGAPPRDPAKRNVDYFWSTMNFKSDLYADNLVESFGGRKYIDRSLELTKPVNEWAWYTAHGEVRLLLVPAEGNEKFLLQTGWIAEVDGVFKFLTYEYDS